MKKLIYILLLITTISYCQNPALISVSLGVDASIPSLDTPILSNFRVENSEDTHLAFDASNDIAGMTISGFYLGDGLGKIISSITIDGDGLGGYFVLSSGVVYEDNLTIRLANDNVVYAFALTYIINNVTDKSTYANTRWVAVTGSDASDGLTEGTAWRTINKGVGSSPSNCMVNVKAGDYGAETILYDYNDTNGSSGNRKKIRGYKVTAGDITSMYYAYGDGVLDSSEMPLLDGGDRTSGACFNIQKRDYTTFENIQITNYAEGIKAGGTTPGASYLHFNRILIKEIGSTTVATLGSGFSLISTDGSTNRIENSIVINCTGVNIRTYNDFNLINNCKSYADDNSTGDISSTDYYISIYSGSNNIVKDSHAERVGNLSHTGHGIGFKAVSVTTEYNLAFDCTVQGIKGGFEFRHSDCQNNVARNITFTNGGNSITGAIQFSQGTSNNIAEKCYINGTSEAIRFYDTAGEEGNQSGGNYNTVKNCIIKDVTDVIVATDDSGNGLVNTNNKIYNNTIYNATYLFNNNLTVSFDNTNEFVNNIVNTVTNLDRGTSNTVVHNYNNYFGGFAAIGTNQNTDNPNFVDTINFIPQNPLLTVVPIITGVEYDVNNSLRKNPTTPGLRKSITE